MSIVSSRLAHQLPESPRSVRKFKCFYPERTGATRRRCAEAQAYLASRWRKPKPSERVLVAVKVSNSFGAGYGAVAVAAHVW